MTTVSILMIVTMAQYFVNHTSTIKISSLHLPFCPYSFIINSSYIVYDDPSYYIHHYPEFVCPQNFRNLADWVYGWPEDRFNEKSEYPISEQKKLTVPNLPHGSIIYVRVYNISSFFSKIYPYLTNKFVLITGEYDDPMPSRFLRYLEDRHSKIIHWFAQNGDIDAKRSERFTHIPIGINCFEMAEGIRDVHRQYPKHILPSVSNNNLDEPSHYIQPHDITQNVLTNKNQSDKLVLINFFPGMDPSGLRTKLWKDLCKNNQSSFTICYDKPHGVDISSLPTIYRRNRQYPLWLSPRGGGLDCHRTWEAFASIRNLPAGSIIYVKTDRLSSFFTEVYPYLINKFVLITGQGGTQTPGEHIRYLEERHSKIIHWFAQNGDIDATKNERFTHIPVGINCFEMAEGIRDVHRQYPKHILPSVRNNNPDEPPHYIQPLDVTQSVLTNNIQLDKLVLINFSPDTDPTGVRRKLYKDLCENKQSSFTICYDKPGGVNISSLPTIYRRNRQYPLWVSPRGTGIDCHRTWEALYLDIIPIVWHSTLDPLYTNLPIIIINDWSEVNEEFLRNKLHEIAMKKAQQPSVYQYEKLRIAYWREMIIRKSRYAFESSYTRRNRCWRGKTIQ
ncbi:unnamed protein product [Adineta steineri]|uniref:Exostosin GT47 domain-containing protein n=1 Tax=Adineta steineri TaxID=433720 RepID=A0A814H4Y2_9BILA|nr:unnamed protein product [Adineta steineri]